MLSRLLNSNWITPELEERFKPVQESWEKDANFYPALPLVFRAYNECLPENVKVVILGQDPYFDGSATGLAFDNHLSKTKVSPSLKNIIKELVDDTDGFSWNNKQRSYLDQWPSQGVLLINTALTVEPNKAGSHTKLWEPFTEQVIKDLQKKDNIVFILWGNHAKAYKKLITNESHYILEGTHPMPLAANRGGFFGGKYFSKANEYLKKTNQSPINW